MPGGFELEVDLAALPGDHDLGDSVALSGVCCTIASLRDRTARFFLSPETLSRTWLGSAIPGTQLNLEAAVRAGTPLGGHLVQGHVDGLGEVVRGVDRTEGGELAIRLPPGLQRYCVLKGSLTVDGVSLTIASEQPDTVGIAVIPHTAQVTTLGSRRPGDPVHIEVDIIAKYVERMLQHRLG